MPQYQITHQTSYHFDEPVSELEINACLSPRDVAGQISEFHHVISVPMPVKQKQDLDCFGNIRTHLFYTKALQRIDITAVSTVAVSSQVQRNNNQLNGPQWHELYSQEELNVTASLVADYAHECTEGITTTVELVNAVMQKIYRDFVYDLNATSVSTSLNEVLTKKRGVCQDFARAMIAILQLNNIPACYVSGYLFCGENTRGTARQAASHAWVMVDIPQQGWVGVDPTNNQWVNEDYVVLAWGRDYADIIPVEGVLKKDYFQRLNVSVTIEKLDH